ncbi:MAG: aminotransferase class V-fold PLP-dependent enzyme [bacterium]|nr:aminotransferase class V-fold PLP-dependent enzyme [bacterium]
MNRFPTPPTCAAIRAAFPAVCGDTVFLENAGGSQVPACVADAMHRTLRETYVQLGAGYGLSRRCTATVEAAHAFARTFVGARRGQAIIGPSTTALLNLLAACYAQVLEPGREIILAETGHEANLGCWKRLERLGLVIRWWRVDPRSFECPLDGLRTLLNERTALVALPHVSNLLGGVVDLPAVVALAHAAGARVVADGVAYAPHRAIDVDAWDVDWYVYSTYKVFGPHMAVLYGRDDALAELPGPNHDFIPRDDLPYQFEPGGANHEGCAGLLALGGYLAFLAGAPAGTACDRAVVEAAFGRATALEAEPTARLLAWLRARSGVRIIGPEAAGTARVGTVSFVHERKSSREITAAVDASGVAIRCGHMYAYHLCKALGIAVEDGVVRASLVHYNTVEEIDRLIGVLERVV